MEPKICPYLGLIEDPNTNKDFPYEGNTCYRAKRPTPVALSHQRGYCLSDAHITCPGFINGWVNGFPDSLRAYPPTYKKVLHNKWVWGTFAMVLLISVYLIFSQQINALGNNLGKVVSSQFTRPTSTATVQSTRIPTGTFVPPTRTASLTPAAANTSTCIVTDTPSPTFTSSVSETPSQTTEESSYMVEVITKALNIRSEPIYKADGSNIVGTLTKGESIEVYDEQKGWLLTERGWIFKFFTKKVLN